MKFQIPTCKIKDVMQLIGTVNAKEWRGHAAGTIRLRLTANRMDGADGIAEVQDSDFWLVTVEIDRAKWPRYLSAVDFSWLDQFEQPATVQK